MQRVELSPSTYETKGFRGAMRTFALILCFPSGLTNDLPFGIDLPTSTHGHHACDDGNPAPNPHTMPPTVLQDDARDGRPYQPSNAHHQKAHAYPRPNQTPVWTQLHKTRRRHTDERATKEAVKYTHNRHGGHGPRPEQRENKDRRAKGTGNDDVEAARLHCHDVREYPPKYAPRVHDDQEVEAQVRVRDVCADHVVIYVEEGCIEARENQEATQHEEHVCWIPEGRPVDQAAFLAREDAGLHQRYGNRQRS